MSPARTSFSISRLYWNPEHPPPTTATRRPEPCRPSRSMVSLTMAEALSVSLTGAGGSDWVCVGGVRVSGEGFIAGGYLGARPKLGVQRKPPAGPHEFA